MAAPHLASLQTISSNLDTSVPQTVHVHIVGVSVIVTDTKREGMVFWTHSQTQAEGVVFQTHSQMQSRGAACTTYREH